MCLPWSLGRWSQRHQQLFSESQHFISHFIHDNSNRKHAHLLRKHRGQTIVRSTREQTVNHTFSHQWRHLPLLLSAIRELSWQNQRAINSRRANPSLLLRRVYFYKQWNAGRISSGSVGSKCPIKLDRSIIGLVYILQQL